MLGKPEGPDSPRQARGGLGKPRLPGSAGQILATAPSTAIQVGAVSRGLSIDQGVLGSAPHGSLLFSLAKTVGADAFRLTFDLTGLTGNTTTDLATYDSDVAALRRYCRTGA